MNGSKFWTVLALALLLVSLPVAAAEEKAAAPPADKAATAGESKEGQAAATTNVPGGPKGGRHLACDCIFCQAKQQTRDATPWLKLFGDIRLREIFAPNLLLDQQDRHFQRYRFRLGASVEPVENLSFNTRLVYEPRYYCEPSTFEDQWIMDEAIFDRMNVRWAEAFGLPVTLTVGRQDIIFGDGWLVLDGTPLDGSRTIFFDAARMTLDLKDAKTSVDLIYICQQADSDRWLPPICDKDFHNMEQDEKGVILYLTNKSVPNTQLDAYFIYKHDTRELDTGDGVAPWQQGTESDIYTFGGRAVHDLNEHIRLGGEIAGQFGVKDRWIDSTYTQRDLCAWGAKARAAYSFNDRCKNEVHVGYEFLSGDQSSTDGRDEQFDPLWGRWPQFSELYVYPVALENRPGETTNLHRINVGWSMVPTKNLTVGADYHVLLAHHNSNPLREDGGSSALRYFDGGGNCRGQLLVGKLVYKFSPHVSGHALAELFFPGNFYDDNRNEVAGFFRYELVFTW